MWDQTTGDSSIVLAILDTGVDPAHDEFAGKLFPGYDFINDDPEPSDDHGHGTHVAGIAAAATDNAIGIASVDWQTKIMPVKVLGEEGYGTSWTICQGIYFAADFGAKVINMSLGGYEYTAAYDSAIAYAHNHGCVVIAAAGNENTSNPIYPGSLEHVICIAATNKDDEKATFSNYGTYIDLSAPGVAILSTVPRNQYTYYNGTSMSTPLVSGLATLIFASNPLYGPSQVESLLTTYADDLGEPGWDEYYGHGRINVFKSLVGPMPVVLGYYGGTVLDDGVANTGEQFSMMISILNSGDSTAYQVKATLSTDDPYVTIDQDYSRYGDIPAQGIVTGIDTFDVQFHGNMPKDHKVWFYLTIEDSLGIIYADGFMIKEGEYLPGFIGPKTMKDRLRGYVNRGYTVYLPQGNLVYKDFSGTGFASNDLEKMGGEGGSAWYTYEEWWERFGASCVHIFYADWYYAMSRFWELIYVECEITTPEHYAAFPIGDTIPIVVHYDAEFHYEPEHYSWDETYIWNTSEPPNLGAEWVPGLYQIWPVEYAWDRGFYYEESESRIYCLFTFEILEDFVKKYFNPLKPDSARIVYQIWPDLYADPKIEPSPKKMEVEIRDKDSVLVFGPDTLTHDERKDQVLFWDGRDNEGDTVDLEKTPYDCQLTLYYRETGKRFLQGCSKKTPLYPTEFNLIAYDYLGNEVPEDEEVAPGAFVHFNLDNDNASDNDLGSPKHPGGDYLEDGPVGDEDDPKLAKIEIKPLLEAGRVELKRDNTNIKVWSSSNKGADKKVLYDNDVKSWNLADPDQRAEFEALKENLWVEGLTYNGKSRLFIWYYDASGTRWCGDLVKYHFIAADCGVQPKTEGEDGLMKNMYWQWVPYTDRNQREHFEHIFFNDSLKGCEWSFTDTLVDTVVGGATIKRSLIEYNCIAWSAGENDIWYNPWDIDQNPNWGDNDGIFEDSDMDGFYNTKKGWQLITEGTNEEKATQAEAMYYSYGVDWDYYSHPEPPPVGFHAAKRHQCECGASKWIMYESKCGQWERIEHIWNQLNYSSYGDPDRFYK